MDKNLLHVKKMLDKEAVKRNCAFELSMEATADPLQVASKYKDEYISLLCALYAYGNARAIVKFLQSLDFSLLSESEEKIKEELQGKIYRFQSTEDVIQSFITLKRAKEEFSLNEKFLQGYQKENSVMDGLSSLINALYEINSYTSKGYTFLLGKSFTLKAMSPYKRWNMYLRWMVRKDELDMGLWSGVEKKDLLIPLDTHTHKVALKLGLINRKSYDFKAVEELSEVLRSFDKNDPIKYDFALYRLGQEKIVTS